MNFSAWLRETGRLYLRYMALGLASIPFAIAYAFAKQAGWDDRLLLPILAICGFVTAGLVWKQLGDWQLKRPPADVVRQPANTAALLCDARRQQTMAGGPENLAEGFLVKAFGTVSNWEEASWGEWLKKPLAEGSLVEYFRVANQNLVSNWDESMGRRLPGGNLGWVVLGENVVGDWAEWATRTKPLAITGFFVSHPKDDHLRAAVVEGAERILLKRAESQAEAAGTGAGARAPVQTRRPVRRPYAGLTTFRPLQPTPIQ